MRSMTVWGIALCIPGLALNAQTVVRSAVRTGNTLQKAPPNACATLTTSSGLVRTPEGVMLMRLKKEFDGVAAVLEQRNGAVEGMDVRRFSDAQRDIDSLLQIVVRTNPGDSTLKPTITMRRVDTLRGADGRLAGQRLIVQSNRSGVHTAAGSPSLEITLRDLSSTFSSIATVASQALNNASPTGYLGMSLSGSQVRLMTDSGLYTTHCDLPVIETVDVGSPARRAGLLAGDTVTAYNGRDILLYSVNYPQLLVPGSSVRVRVKREGKSRELPVTVGERPAGFAESQVRVVSPPPNGNFFFFQRADDDAGIEVRRNAPVSSWTFETRAPAPVAVPAPVPVLAPTPSVVAASATMGIVFGAELSAIDDEFANRFQLEPGVLITRVPTGTAAFDAGLKSGEMIRAVNGIPVRELSAIRRAISLPGVRSVKLTVTGRDAPARIVTVKW